LGELSGQVFPTTPQEYSRWEAERYECLAKAAQRTACRGGPTFALTPQTGSEA